MYMYIYAHIYTHTRSYIYIYIYLPHDFIVFIAVAFADAQQEGFVESELGANGGYHLFRRWFENGRRAVVGGADDAGVAHAIQLTQVICR